MIGKMDFVTNGQLQEAGESVKRVPEQGSRRQEFSTQFYH